MGTNEIMVASLPPQKKSKSKERALQTVPAGSQENFSKTRQADKPILMSLGEPVPQKKRCPESRLFLSFKHGSWSGVCGLERSWSEVGGVGWSWAGVGGLSSWTFSLWGTNIVAYRRLRLFLGNWVKSLRWLWKPESSFVFCWV